MNDALLATRLKPALQQPDWSDAPQIRRVRDELSSRPALVRSADVRTLRAHLAQVARGESQVVQAGDCAEDPAECTSGYVARKAGLLDVLAGVMKMITHKPVVRAGRMAGQFAKPRSRPTEVVGGAELPVYRGHMVNSPEPHPERRRPDPQRLLSGYLAAGEAMSHLGWLAPARRSGVCPPVWTSHEALLLDYELPMVRADETGRALLTSTHWPWIGERTRQVDGAHVALLAEVANPVACKVGPTMDPAELLTLCELLDPAREHGRLTLIARMGADAVSERLPALVEAVRAEGHPVIWLTDPMHGNTVTAPDGLKTRLLDTVVREVRGFQCSVRTAGGVAGGLHLETTPEDVTECVRDESGLAHVGDKYTSFCDPRLNPAQAIEVVSAWQG
ncbi:3-deoxy-7-phosphoheptulonate synthase [Streptomyces albireticuli]|uniref:Phospho-2-dehydro-3-deoxyheptonate aldolase n=1 Tax=Streptomyces albireticuli TaxID=1940 RepID=A0A2A2DEV0_9ACTN|nr:3-deoxy-7-phosphoheptulonate synthase [Streptomyces albireticuli]MCD9145508.1 3-deoxy-7-phosphoheptulonate synthase [Streptomyces albireticuli]MCD9165203.1 3-deoxy-7-phosphoheptulonate synthase [Streptomyces albireticuli]MCD9195732.1 3-deoxy-7-phosphoheptulonate synthase [Streptomyces albireticuli]PAU49860.1 phospho-2-dehydro-3-deoxyheptonate aldolase [Streptomyces albireticuli]